MNRIKSFITIGAFSLLVLALPVVASAQWQGQNRNDDFWRNNRNIRGTVMSLQNRARNFERQVSRIDDRRDNRRSDRYDRVDNLDMLASRFKNAAENLADEVGRGRSMNMNSSRDEARRVLDLGSQIDQVLSRARGVRNNARNLEGEWRQIESDLRTIAGAYGLSYNRNRSLRDRLGF